ncbi:bifunctional nicotinamidase/pyrazinamidase [Algoriphagus mannitolivorans]|uniref:bifunctional nicotinamidase/pyrazinamidase n=1 Tax=Algoriphagus mannitolivorans TaxID=226504 RepID=UPI000418DE22|nr:bifunctional nicotinamidase/pyrazinamidase [Algoriphagus mannitolivorans]
MDIKQNSTALLIVDVQNDFIPGGALEVKDGDQIIPMINAIQKKFSHVIVTQDFHPANHGSFASQYDGKSPGEFVVLGGLDQILWPDHCVQGTFGAEFHKDLDQSNWEVIFQKGKNPEVDSYSGFFDNARKGDTGLNAYLKAKGIDTVFVCGLALDYCVKFTALDAKSLGFETFLIEDATRAVNLSPSDGKDAIEEMRKSGIQICTYKEFL